jgi:serine/threonine-protein kinase HipA
MTTIALYADWFPGREPAHFADLDCYQAGGAETFALKLSKDFQAHPDLLKLSLDPDIAWQPGPQYPRAPRSIFGLLQDSSPDRWGRMLMNRRLERDKRAGRAEKDQRLGESDYLLGVHDAFRVGVLRLRLNDEGPFLDDRQGRAAPPMASLGTLEMAARAIDSGDDSPAVDEWLRLLVAPGGSLGGARPKASVAGENGSLWIAKFPSAKDTHDLGAWELLTQVLAKACNIRVPPAQARKFASSHHTFIVARFDRPTPTTRQHFASAMTLTGNVDGNDASSGVSYLDIAEVLIDHGANTTEDLRELWRRIVFNLCVSNTDDHLRNHGFLLEPGKGWRLSPAYDMNPSLAAAGLKLNITQHDNAMNLDLAREVAEVFRYAPTDADQEIARIQQMVRQWPTLAGKLGISAKEQAMFSGCFALAG